MIQDFAIEQDEKGAFDLVIDKEKRDFKSVEGMETAIDFQLFVDKRADRNEVSTPRRRQGWIGDLLTVDQGYQAGSLIWLKNQARSTQNDNNLVAAYANDSLKYLVSIGAAKEIESIAVDKNISGKIKISDDELVRYNRLWRATNAT